jgi:hypothetical protein
MESRTTELCNKLYKTEEEQHIFLGFRILKQERKETTNKEKYFWIFQISNQKWRTKQTKARKLKGKQRETTEIFLVFLCFRK